MEHTEANHAYFPVRVGEEYELSRDETYSLLREKGIYSRRYFYPLISDFPMYRDLPSAGSEHLPRATELASEILCLPIYPGLDEHDQARVIDALREGQARGR